MAAEDPRETTECFVVMPISVPTHLMSRYGGRTDHFSQIYRTLIAPAVKRAGLQPTPPGREGTENIQAAIINDLHDSQLVLARYHLERGTYRYRPPVRRHAQRVHPAPVAVRVVGGSVLR